MKLDLVVRKLVTFDCCGRGFMHLFTFHAWTQVCVHANSKWGLGYVCVM